MTLHEYILSRTEKYADYPALVSILLITHMSIRNKTRYSKIKNNFKRHDNYTLPGVCTPVVKKKNTNESKQKAITTGYE